MISTRLLLTILALMTGGCRGVATRSADAGPCVRSGDRCEFAPGKIGLCVESDGENGARPLLCQSQH